MILVYQHIEKSKNIQRSLIIIWSLHPISPVFLGKKWKEVKSQYLQCQILQNTMYTMLPVDQRFVFVHSMFAEHYSEPKHML
jgi:hypothetical protein